MPKLNVYNMAGVSVGEMNLSDAVFGIEPNKAVLHEVVRNYLANQRQGTQSTLTRAEVSGGGRKPWRQKGTGRARQGSIRSPQWRHGGIAFGPKPRSYRFTVNKKVRRLAMKSALSAKVLANEMMVLEGIELESYKTREIANMLAALGAQKKALIVTSTADQRIVKSAGNIPGVKTAEVGSLNVYDIMNCDSFIIVKAAAQRLEEVYA